MCSFITQFNSHTYKYMKNFIKIVDINGRF